MRNLLELALKAAIVSCEISHTETIIKFAKKHNYLLTVSEQSVMQALMSTQAGMQLEGDYRLLRLLGTSDITYKIVITEHNRKKILAR